MARRPLHTRGIEGHVVKAVDLLDYPRPALFELLRTGHRIHAADLDDTEYRGISLGLPRAIEQLTWKTFKKVFHRDLSGGVLRGWNVRIEQTGLEAPFEPKQKNGAPVTFGHYVVVPIDDQPMPRPVPNGLLIDYGRGGNKRFDPVGRLRDPIVALEADDPTVLLGWSFVALPGRPVSTPSFFVLERDGPLTHTADPPGRPCYAR